MAVAAVDRMADLQHILVATDFGSSSVRAVRFAAELAARLAAKLTVLHIVQNASNYYSAKRPFALPIGAPDELERGARWQLDAFLESLAETTALRDGVVRFGEPAREIVAEAEESDCDLVVLGTQGREGLQRWLLGSVAERVVRSSHVPVLTVRAEPSDVVTPSSRAPGGPEEAGSPRHSPPSTGGAVGPPRRPRE